VLSSGVAKVPCVQGKKYSCALPSSKTTEFEISAKAAEEVKAKHILQLQQE